MLALGFGYLASNNNEKFLLSTFDNKLERFVPKKGMRQVAAMYSYLNTKKPKGTTKFESALVKYKALIGSKSLVIIVSDLLYNPKEIRDVLTRLRGSEVKLIQVLDKNEENIAEEGHVVLKD